ncbi:MAG: serine/threonine-protein kinase, partial [Vicinamibacterales bacterium]
MIGKTVGKYRIVERLGRGGMGTVYKAIDETLDREVAIKVLNADLGDSELLKRFRAEAVTLARLNHPGIATLYELYRDDTELLMVMEFVRGETVHELSERMGALAPPQAAHLAMQVLDALSHAHRAGVVHRDLKPANLMINEMGIVKVMDFGIARVLGTEHFTQGGYMMGTPAYMAPEQVLGGDIDGRADLYAVGVVLYRLLSGQLPFSADTAIAMVQKQVNDSPIPIAQFQPDLPGWCAKVLTRSLAKAPADRFQTADEFRTALLSAVQPQALGELPTMATPTPRGLASTFDQTNSATAVRYDQRASAAAVATPLATSVPGTVPALPPPVAAPITATTAIASGGPNTVVIARKHLFGAGATMLVVILLAAAGGFYMLRRSSFPSQLQIGAVPAEEAKPGTDPALAATQPEAAPAAPVAPPSAPGAIVPAPPGTVPPVKPGGRAGSATDPTLATALGGARGPRGTVPPAAPTDPAAVPPPAAEPPPAAVPPPAAPTAAAVTFSDVRVIV